MITRFLAAAGRRRRGIFVIALVLSAGYLLVHAWVPSLGQRAFPAMAAASAVFVVLALVAVAGERPMAFVVRPDVRAFSAPPHPTPVFLVLAFIPVATGMLGGVVRDRGSDPFLPDQLLALTYAAVLALWIVAAWRDTGVQLRPDGLWQRGITGWLVVPWDAGPTVPTLPPPPTARTVRLTYDRPELVRRHGLHVYRHRLRTDDIDPRFLCAAIRHYMAHPEHRPAIGTQGEYGRVVPHLHDSLDWSPPPVKHEDRTVAVEAES